MIKPYSNFFFLFIFFQGDYLVCKAVPQLLHCLPADNTKLLVKSNVGVTRPVPCCASVHCGTFSHGAELLTGTSKSGPWSFQHFLWLCSGIAFLKLAQTGRRDHFVLIQSLVRYSSLVSLEYQQCVSVRASASHQSSTKMRQQHVDLDLSRSFLCYQDLSLLCCLLS